jgi:membrane protease YdiL (CAAX protease family)
MRGMLESRRPLRAPRASPRRLLETVAGAALAMLCWVTLAIAAGLLPAPFGALATLLVGGLFLYRCRFWPPRPGTLRALAEVRLRPVGVRRGWLAGALAAFVIADVGYVLWWQLFGPAPGPASPLRIEDVSWVSLCLVVPVIEEVSFRGRMLRRLEGPVGRVPATAITALVFALMHLQLAGIPHRFALGVIAALAVYATRSLWSAVWIHAAHNTLALLISRLHLGENGALPLGLPGRAIIAATSIVGLLGLAVAAGTWWRGRGRWTPIGAPRLIDAPHASRTSRQENPAAARP